jgi:hypothetical protein
MKKIYYAHAYCTYGSRCEAAEIKVIRSGLKRHKLVNPSHYNNHPEKRRDSMGFCLRLVEECDILAFSRILKQITCGVGKEVNHALKKGLVVYEITRDGLVRRRRKVKYIPYEATIGLYGIWRVTRRGQPW